MAGLICDLGDVRHARNNYLVSRWERISFLFALIFIFLNSETGMSNIIIVFQMRAFIFARSDFSRTGL